MDQTLNSEVETLARNTNKPNLVALSYALRHPETWPEDFLWNYGHCQKCAVGLAAAL